MPCRHAVRKLRHMQRNVLQVTHRRAPLLLVGAVAVAAVIPLPFGSHPIPLAASCCPRWNEALAVLLCLTKGS